MEAERASQSWEEGKRNVLSKDGRGGICMRSVIEIQSISAIATNQRKMKMKNDVEKKRSSSGTASPVISLR